MKGALSERISKQSGTGEHPVETVVSRVDVASHLERVFDGFLWKDA